MTTRGQAKILDFGIAKLVRGEGTDTHGTAQITGPGEIECDVTHLTRTGFMMGTAAYMSPEQARREELDARTDIFSFGAVPYETATNRPAFSGNMVGILLDGILHQQPVSLCSLVPEAPAQLEEIVNRALEKDRDRRYATALNVVLELRSVKRYLESRQGQSRPDTEREEPVTRLPLRQDPIGVRPARKRTRWMTAVALCAALAIIGMTGYLFSHIDPAQLTYTQITDFTDSATAPALSPDGRMVAFIRGGVSFF